MLHNILSFLSAQAAVQTCVLARRWRHLWRSTTGLRIGSLDGADPVQDLWVFVDHLLILRERTDLDTVEIKLVQCSEDDEPYVKLWTRFAVMCKVRVLTLHIYDPYLYLEDLPIVSRHLTTLDLEGLGLNDTFLDFASCPAPALEHLKMNVCDVSVDKISSHTLKHLSITNCRADSGEEVHLSTPGLISLKLDGFAGSTPILENMASLETALDCGSLLGGISSAKHLELISEFGKGPNHMVEMKGSYSSVERLPGTSEHLNIVEVKCNTVDGRILKVLKFLCAFNIRFSFE
ncbi:unnamed protein product [Alopecurus aequalis]